VIAAFPLAAMTDSLAVLLDHADAPAAADTFPVAGGDGWCRRP
jgi:hypothetical protein